jgi:mannosyl-oligosaccharide alpha-1,2-mannosidase
VKEAFERCWKSYRKLAWQADELAPVSGLPRNGLGGWGTTLVDNLDTLWIMGMHDEFNEAVEAVIQIRYEDTSSPHVNTHETNTRHLGGLLAAFDLSGDRRLLDKAVTVGNMLYAAFDTPNRMPTTHWDLHRAARQEEQLAEEVASPSELGSFILEFTRLSQITGDQKYFSAAQQVMTRLELAQDLSKLSGLWPTVLNARAELVDGDLFTMGPEADSLYKTLPKAYAMLGGHLPMYRTMYEKATRAAASHSLFRPMNAEDKDILVPGSVRVTMTQNGKPRTHLEPQVHHCACFAGGMFAMGGALFNIPIHRKIAEKLVDGCIWASQAMPMGIMPEVYEAVPCASQTSCPWNEWHWKQEVWKKANSLDPDPSLDVDMFISDRRIPRGFIAIPDTRYNLRPETIESMFMLYRVTGREDLLDTAWEMFERIQNATRVEYGNAGIIDVTDDQEGTGHSDSMESYWMAQTLKYFYLMFSAPDVLSLDHYVFNSAGHPLKLPQLAEMEKAFELN